jgi:hypothetical protein
MKTPVTATARTFKCDFGDGVSCQVVATANPPAKGTAHIRRVVWEGRPTKQHIRPYIVWMNTVNAMLADEWGGALMHVFQVSRTRAECWVYEPGEAPKLLHTISAP